jgi:hypothetical protein
MLPIENNGDQKNKDRKYPPAAAAFGLRINHAENS